MKVRNEDARCENCPYFFRSHFGLQLEDCGYEGCEKMTECRIHAPVRDLRSNVENMYPPVGRNHVCGEHPDFFKETGECQTNTD